MMRSLESWSSFLFVGVLESIVCCNLPLKLLSEVSFSIGVTSVIDLSALKLVCDAIRESEDVLFVSFGNCASGNCVAAWKGTPGLKVKVKVSLLIL